MYVIDVIHMVIQRLNINSGTKIEDNSNRRKKQQLRRVLLYIAQELETVAIWNKRDEATLTLSTSAVLASKILGTFSSSSLGADQLPQLPIFLHIVKEKSITSSQIRRLYVYFKDLLETDMSPSWYPIQMRRELELLRHQEIVPLLIACFVDPSKQLSDVMDQIAYLLSMVAGGNCCVSTTASTAATTSPSTTAVASTAATTSASTIAVASTAATTSNTATGTASDTTAVAATAEIGVPLLSAGNSGTGTSSGVVVDPPVSMKLRDAITNISPKLIETRKLCIDLNKMVCFASFLTHSIKMCYYLSCFFHYLIFLLGDWNYQLFKSGRNTCSCLISPYGCLVCLVLDACFVAR